MKVKQLKAILATLPDDMEILADTGHDLPAMVDSSKYKFGVRELLGNFQRVFKHPHVGNLVASKPCKETEGAEKCLIL